MWSKTGVVGSSNKMTARRCLVEVLEGMVKGVGVLSVWIDVGLFKVGVCVGMEMMLGRCWVLLPPSPLPPSRLRERGFFLGFHFSRRQYNPASVLAFEGIVSKSPDSLPISFHFI